MPTLRHVVIFLYIALLCLFFGITAVRRSRRIAHDAVLAMSVFMIVRILIKFVYFYVEFYIASWHLSILFNFLMDSTYVVSIGLVLSYVARRLDDELPCKRLYCVAAILYVLGFSLISFLWVDRASNHNILIQGGLPQLLYNANELFFLLVCWLCCLTVMRRASTRAAIDLDSVLMLADVAVYSLYIFLWDVSFTIDAVSGIRGIKPFDGVLVFALVLGCVLARVTAGEVEQAEPQREELASPDLDELARAFDLTGRETDVFMLLMFGHSNPQIAEQLSISPNTVKRHVYSIYRKAGVSSRYELMSVAGLSASDENANPHLQ